MVRRGFFFCSHTLNILFVRCVSSLGPELCLTACLFKYPNIYGQIPRCLRSPWQTHRKLIWVNGKTSLSFYVFVFSLLKTTLIIKNSTVHKFKQNLMPRMSADPMDHMLLLPGLCLSWLGVVMCLRGLEVVFPWLCSSRLSFNNPDKRFVNVHLW